MEDWDYAFGGIAMILRYLFYLAIPVVLGILIYKLVAGIKKKNKAAILKSSVIMVFALIYTIMCFVSIPSLPVSIKTKNISDAAKMFGQLSEGHYVFSFGCCEGSVFVSEYENREDANNALSDFAEIYETDIKDKDGIKFSKTSYESLRSSYEDAGFLGGIEDAGGAWLALACETKYVEITYSYFTSGPGSVFRGLIPLDMIIRPRFDLLKAANNLTPYTEPVVEDFDVPMFDD